jgi:hypothetical protein
LKNKSGKLSDSQYPQKIKYLGIDIMKGKKDLSSEQCKTRKSNTEEDTGSMQYPSKFLENSSQE